MYIMNDGVTNNEIVINDIDIIEFSEFILSIIHDYLETNMEVMKEENYQGIIFEITLEILQICYDESIMSKEELFKLIGKNMDFYFNNIAIVRSYPNSIILKKCNIEKMEKHLKYLQNLPQPTQKVDEWYILRWNHLTASSIYKAIETSQCKQNELILSKCKPLDIQKKKGININSPFHHGHKYEPLSLLFYEKIYNTKVGEFGCIKHKEIEHLAASPDGINIKKENPRYGRLLEIKNIVNREINGIPKKQYWIQMQMQMECTELDECDFLETRFKEYENEEEFEKDGTFNLTKEEKIKGIIINFYSTEGPLYKYMPLNYSREQYEKWYNNIMDENNNLTWIRNIYWHLDQHSCVLVIRNKKWFDCVSPEFKKTWDIILKERKTGYDHRKPKKRIKKQTNIIIIKVNTESIKVNTESIKVNTESLN